MKQFTLLYSTIAIIFNSSVASSFLQFAHVAFKNLFIPLSLPHFRHQSSSEPVSDSHSIHYFHPAFFSWSPFHCTLSLHWCPIPRCNSNVPRPARFLSILVMLTTKMSQIFSIVHAQWNNLMTIGKRSTFAKYSWTLSSLETTRQVNIEENKALKYFR